ncbi:hypothetical protein [Streptomyces sp. NBC_00344]|uniref:hypothetical protein n=1 Tax=Streptomyces sp. NBC_00344 TaxID=2975720 RepID=UPI002E24C9D6
MRWTSIGSAALLSVAAISLSAPAATAGDDGDITSFGFTASPASVAPGDSVTLTVTGCEAPSATATSGVFDTVTLKKGQPATAVVDPETKPGAQYDVTFDCDGETGTTPLTVAGGPVDKGDTAVGGDTGGRDEPGGTGGRDEPGGTGGWDEPGGTNDRHDTGDKTKGHTKPDKGVKAGFGGSVSGTNPAELVAGGALIAGALGGVLHLRRRSARDRT